MNELQRRAINKHQKQFSFLWAIRARWDNVHLEFKRMPKDFKNFDQEINGSHELWVILDDELMGPLAICHEVSSGNILLCGKPIMDYELEYIKMPDRRIQYLVSVLWKGRLGSMLKAPNNAILMTIVKPYSGESLMPLANALDPIA